MPLKSQTVKLFKFVSLLAIIPILLYISHLFIADLILHNIILTYIEPNKNGVKLTTNKYDDIDFKTHYWDAPNINFKHNIANSITDVFTALYVNNTSDFIFKAEADDACSVWIDGHIFINQNRDIPRYANIKTRSLKLRSGYHLLHLRLYNGPGQSRLVISMSDGNTDSFKVIDNKKLYVIDLGNIVFWSGIIELINTYSLTLAIWTISLVIFIGVIAFIYLSLPPHITFSYCWQSFNPNLETHQNRGTKITYRPDIDGLRCIAILGVLLFHAKISLVSGGFCGVDIFFAISGYLITSILIREWTKNGSINFLNFWARRTRRLAPSALLVVLVTLIVSQYVMSKLQGYFAACDAIHASTYIINWTKLFSATNYFQDTSDLEPFLHYWSLAVEEQYYLYITLIFTIAFIIKRFFVNDFSWSTIKVITSLLLVSGALSLFANFYYIGIAQPIAFFGTHTRIWQLVVGACVALIEQRGFIPKKSVRSVSAWAGLAAILVSNFLYDEDLSYPGYYALLPTFGAFLLIFAGINSDNASKPVLLKFASKRLPVTIGKLSYSLYLWHWPVFILWRTYFGNWDVFDIALTILITFILATLGHVLVENPLRFSQWLLTRPVKSLVGAVAFLCIVISVGVSVRTHMITKGIIVLNSGKAYSAIQISKDIPDIYKAGCHLNTTQNTYSSCIFGQRDSNKKVFIIGDSHMAQWFSALDKIGKDEHFALYARTLASCPPFLRPTWNRRWKGEYSECTRWNERVLVEIEKTKPDVVIASFAAQYTLLDDNGKIIPKEKRFEAMRQAERKMIKRIRATGAQVVLIKDTPRFNIDPLNCLVSNPRNSQKCITARSKACIHLSPLSITAGSNIPGVHLLDMTEIFCKGDNCFVADDERVFMRDDHHIASSFALSIADVFRKKLSPILTQVLRQ
jgi:peptidoglycan/LPS O-acetylase OafA/YrhL